jgi:SMC interacting uncharacterized protein involved in chromosome segregation
MNISDVDKLQEENERMRKALEKINATINIIMSPDAYNDLNEGALLCSIEKSVREGLGKMEE